MTLSKALEELLKTLPADVQAQQRAILEKHPTLGEGWLRQSDYDRMMNENKTKIEAVDRVKAWHEEYKPKYDNLVRENATLTSQKSEWEASKTKLEADLATASAAAAAAKAGEGGNVDPAKIAEAVKAAIGNTIPTKTEIAALVAAEAEKQVKTFGEASRKQFYENDFAQSAQWITGMNDVMWRYRDEFGKPLDRAEFAKFMTEKKITDPIVAYDEFTKEAKTEKEVQKRVDAKLEEEKKNNPAPGIPGTSGAPGHLQIRIAARKPDDPLFGKEFELGDNTAAMAAAAELRAEAGRS